MTLGPPPRSISRRSVDIEMFAACAIAARGSTVQSGGIGSIINFTPMARLYGTLARPLDQYMVANLFAQEGGNSSLTMSPVFAPRPGKARCNQAGPDEKHKFTPMARLYGTLARPLAPRWT